MKNKKIAIIGGGPGGLTLARLLQMKGYEVKVYERDTDQNVRQQGATLDLHEESGLKALIAAGLLNEFKKHYRPGADKLRVTDHNAVVHFDDHTNETPVEKSSASFRPEIDRGPFRDLLIASLEKGTVVWNSKFVSLQAKDNGWDIFFASGSTVYADLVIAADGANSKIRKYLTDIAPVYSGMTIVEGNIYNAEINAPELWKLAKGGKIFALGLEKSIILSVKGDGSLSFYTGTREMEDWVKTSGINFENKLEIYDWFKERFADWGNQWHELFVSDDSYFVPRPQYHFPIDQQWESLPNLTMLGDAAHRMPPYAGEGVNMAMLDALELVEQLTATDISDLKTAVSKYERTMRKRAAEITEVTMQSMENMHSKEALKFIVNTFHLIH
ncbi:FAD-dependent oxidoreductase [Pedobacter xixiisoli]|uniref:Flavin-dependent monooxygenase n=1 Tax=Pedobacter xixiisoli TaxID=1476464 RepID=A0A285ZS82_9SPHI|nr:NAD(P)/FAD-dependent oxidoreductase [Pedobacter xixiisoli]SOD12501.1 2-polyprenyl-6-methoxyphenol hydroxylase [Pedobacter xixiisoli]